MNNLIESAILPQETPNEPCVTGEMRASALLPAAKSIFIGHASPVTGINFRALRF